MRAPALLLGATALPLLALPASASGASDAASVSFELGAQRIELVAAAEQGGDVLLLRVTDCTRRGCAETAQRTALGPGRFEVDGDTARLAVVLDGRALRAAWKVAGDGVVASTGRVESDGASDRTSAQSFAGRTAVVDLVVDGVRCRVDGAVGTALVAETAASTGAVELGRSPLSC